MLPPSPKAAPPPPAPLDAMARAIHRHTRRQDGPLPLWRDLPEAERARCQDAALAAMLALLQHLPANVGAVVAAELASHGAQLAPPATATPRSIMEGELARYGLRLARAEDMPADWDMQGHHRDFPVED